MFKQYNSKEEKYSSKSSIRYLPTTNDEYVHIRQTISKPSYRRKVMTLPVPAGHAAAYLVRESDAPRRQVRDAIQALLEPAMPHGRRVLSQPKIGVVVRPGRSHPELGERANDLTLPQIVVSIYSDRPWLRAVLRHGQVHGVLHPAARDVRVRVRKAEGDVARQAVPLGGHAVALLDDDLLVRVQHVTFDEM